MKRLNQFSPHPLMMSNREQVGKNENSTHLMMIPWNTWQFREICDSDYKGDTHELPLFS